MKRDFIGWTSYKFALILEIAGLFTSLITFFFIARLIGLEAAPYLEIYGGDYFSFYLVGAILSAYFWRGFSTFVGTIEGGQVSGTLEIMLVTPTQLSTVLLSSSLFGFIYTTVMVLIQIIMGVLLGVNFGNINIISSFVVFSLTIITFSALGLMSAAFILAFKRGDPIAWFIGGVGSLLGGQLFPVTLLPGWLQNISEFIPITHALHAMRLAVLRGYDILALSNEILILVAFSVILVPLSIMTFNAAVQKAKKDGSLLKY